MKLREKIKSAICIALTPLLLNLEAKAIDGFGTLEDPYKITNIQELQQIKNELNAHYNLNNNIDAIETQDWNDNQGFTPIGNQTNNFTGNFNGQNYEINNLYINRPSEEYVGLFGITSGQIKNLGLKNVNITGSEGNGMVGALAGENQGIIINCHST